MQRSNMKCVLRQHYCNYHRDIAFAHRHYTNRVNSSFTSEPRFCLSTGSVSGWNIRTSQYHATAKVLGPEWSLQFKSKGVFRTFSSTKPPNLPGSHVFKDDQERYDAKTKDANEIIANFDRPFISVKGVNTNVGVVGLHGSEKSSLADNNLLFTSSVSTNLRSDKGKEEKEAEDWNDILNRWYIKYQDFIGITELKKAQDKVTELSEVLLGTQSRRRELQAEIEHLQEKLITNHQRTTKAEPYSEEHYQLFDQARAMNSRLKEVRTEFEQRERLERDTFTQLSAAIRDCHERERTQAEQSKYWSIIASVVSAALASVFTSVNNWVRIREIKDHVSTNNKELLTGYQEMHADITKRLSAIPLGIQEGAVEAPDTSSITTASEGAVQQSQNLPEDSKPPTAEMLTKKDVNDVVISVQKTLSDHVIKIVTSLQKTLSEQSVKELNETATQVFTEQVIPVLRDERKVLLQELNSQLETNFAKVELLSNVDFNQLSKDIASRVKDHLDAFIDASNLVTSVNASTSGPEEELSQSRDKDVVVDYSYRHIATAMAVGAAIGTLVTAFMLGSFGNAGA